MAKNNELRKWRRDQSIIRNIQSNIPTTRKILSVSCLAVNITVIAVYVFLTTPYLFAPYKLSRTYTIPLIMIVGCLAINLRTFLFCDKLPLIRRFTLFGAALGSNLFIVYIGYILFSLFTLIPKDGETLLVITFLVIMIGIPSLLLGTVGGWLLGFVLNLLRK